MKQVLPATITMIAYAACLVALGVLTYIAAPPGARAATALIFPGLGAALMIVCAVLLIQFRTSPRNAKLGLYASYVIAVLMVIGPAMRVPKSLAASRQYHEAMAAQTEGDVQHAAGGETDAQSPIAAEPKGYQAVGLGGVAALSLFALIALVAQRPAIGQRKREKTPEPVPAIGDDRTHMTPSPGPSVSTHEPPDAHDPGHSAEKQDAEAPLDEPNGDEKPQIGSATE